MKTLAVTFFTAIAIIALALVCDMAARNFASDNALVGKTTVTRDAYGRVVSELTVAFDGNEWRETTMRKLSYYDGQNEAVSYEKVDGLWVATSKVVTETLNGQPVSFTYYVASPNGSKWDRVAKQMANDLSSSDVLDDYVFDADGNLVMKATYVYRDGEKLGISKEEFSYQDNTPTSRVSYAWNGDSWDKALSSDFVGE